MLRKEASIFLVVGSLTVGVDFFSYHGLLWLGLSYPLAKAVSFIAGTIFAYFANRFWTFRHIKHTPNSMLRFVALYSITLGANVLVNQLLLGVAGSSASAINMVFVLATGVSAVLNFLGMKFFVFVSPKARA